MAAGAVAVHEDAYALKAVTQKKDALVDYDTKNFKIVNNKNYGTHNVTSFENNGVFTTTAHKYGTKKGNKKATLKTFAYLPVSYEGSGDMGNPQSVNLSLDGHYAYVTYPKPKSSTLGRIIRYDMWKLKELGVDTGDMSVFVRAAHNNANGRAQDDIHLEYLSCMKIGPWCKIGHGNAISLNPKDGCLWFLGETGKVKTNLQRINMKTLKPDLKISFKFSSEGRAVSNNLAFDKKGRCYFYNYSGPGNLPVGTIKIYQGTIKKNKAVSFKLIRQGIKNSPTRNIQSMGYNPKSNRLYMVGNGVVMSVPVAKLGKMKKSDVHLTIFKGKREYEDIAFDKKGNGYLLVNKMPELLKLSKGF